MSSSVVRALVRRRSSLLFVALLLPASLWLHLAATPARAVVRAGDDDVKVGVNPFPDEWFYGDEKVRARHDKLCGKPMPSLEGLEDFVPEEAGTYALANRVGVIVIWSTTNDRGIEALPQMEALQQKYKDKKVVVFGVCTHYPQDLFKKILTDRKITFVNARDPLPQCTVMKAFGASEWPTIAVTDRKGRVRAVGVKARNVENVLVEVLKAEGIVPPDYAITPSTAGPATQPTTGPTVASAGGGSSSGAKTEPMAAGAINPKWLEGNEAARKRLTAIEGKPAPALKLTGWTGGEATSLDKLKGKVVVLTFWNPTSGVSIAGVARNNALHEKYKDKGLVLIGIGASKFSDNLAAVVQGRKVKYACAADDGGATEKAYKVDNFDDYYLIDRGGKLRIADCDNASVEDAIKMLLAEKP